jgi:flagellar hook-associated protein 3 FlgL
MLNPISTASLYASLTSNIDVSQNQIATATQQVASDKVANDLAGYGQSAGLLTATNSLATRLNTYVTNAQNLSAKLAVQNTALNQVATASQNATSAIQEALANNTGEGLLQTLQSQLASASSALNTDYGGEYLFSGGNANTPPVSTNTLSGLVAAASPSAVFTNGDQKQVSRVDDNQTVQTGVLASDAGTPLLTALAAVQTFNNGPNGPLSGDLTPAQTDFLNGVVSQFQAATDAANTVVADNGNVQKQVTNLTTQLTAQQTTIQGVVTNITEPDQAKVASQLQLAQATLQASAQVFSSLQSASLLQVLSSTS